MSTESKLRDLLNGKLSVEEALDKITPREIGDCLFDYSKKLIEFSNTKVIMLLNNLSDRNQKEDVFINIYNRMYLWMNSLVALNHLQHLQGLAPVTRSLFELLLDIKLLSRDDTGQYLNKYISFDEIEMYSAAEKRVSFYEKNFPQKKEEYFIQKVYMDDRERRVRIEENSGKYWGRDLSEMKKIRHWSMMNVRDRANKIGIEYEEIYIKLYYYLSSIVHGYGLSFFRNLRKEHFESFYYYCHEASQKFFIEATKIIASLMKIDQAWEHENLYQKLDDLKNDNMWKFLIYKIEKTENK